jgi:hypothetical protein
LGIPDYNAFIGQWNSRLVGGQFVENPDEITPAYINRLPVVWTGTHLHTSLGENDAYEYSNVYLVDVPLTGRNKTLTLPNDPNLRVLAASLVDQPYGSVTAAAPLYDETHRTIAIIELERQKFIDQLMVRLSSPIPGADIHYTLDGSDPTPSSQHYFGPFSVSETSTIKARAYKSGMDEAYIAKAVVSKQVPRSGIQPGETKPGLRCTYYSGQWTEVPGFSQLTPMQEMVVDSITLPPFAYKQNFALRFTGYLNIPVDGMYDFYTASDDGSLLMIGDELVVNNDGLHGEQELRGEIALKAGLHPITVTMFQATGGKSLQVKVSGPNLNKRPIPPGWFVHGAN